MATGANIPGDLRHPHGTRSVLSHTDPAQHHRTGPAIASSHFRGEETDTHTPGATCPQVSHLLVAELGLKLRPGASLWEQSEPPLRSGGKGKKWGIQRKPRQQPQGLFP